MKNLVIFDVIDTKKNKPVYKVGKGRQVFIRKDMALRRKSESDDYIVIEYELIPVGALEKADLFAIFRGDLSFKNMFPKTTGCKLYFSEKDCKIAFDKKSKIYNDVSFIRFKKVQTNVY